jgi:DNA polymerase III alpha subunit
MNKIISIFTSHYSIGQSTLTFDVATEDIDINKPVSILSIAKKHKIKPVIVDDDYGGFWELYKNAKESEVDYVYGLRFCLADSIDLASPDFKETHSNVILLFKNSQSYYDAIIPYSEGSRQDTKLPTLTWEQFNKYDLSNFDILIPFYSSFIARNLLNYKHRALSKFNNEIKPLLLTQNQELPFDNLIKNQINDFVKSNDWPTQEAHWVRYYREEDIKRFMALNLITQKQTGAERATFEKPELKHFISDQFSFESYLNKTK